MLVTFEGVGGTGKTFISQYVYKKLNDLGLKVCLLGGFNITPKSSPLTLFIRNELIKKDFFIGLPWLAETHLLIAEFVNEIESNLLPAINDGYIVLFDSYWDSIFAYQHARLENMQNNKRSEYRTHLTALENKICKDFIPSPDIKYYLSGPISLSTDRINTRDQMQLNELEIDTLTKIKDIYEQPERLVGYNIININDDSDFQNDILNQILKIKK